MLSLDAEVNLEYETERTSIGDADFQGSNISASSDHTSGSVLAQILGAWSCNP